MKNKKHVRRSLIAFALAAMSASFVGCATTQTPTDQERQQKLDRTQATHEGVISPDFVGAARSTQPQ